MNPVPDLNTKKRTKFVAPATDRVTRSASLKPTEPDSGDSRAHPAPTPELEELIEEESSVANLLLEEPHFREIPSPTSSEEDSYLRILLSQLQTNFAAQTEPPDNMSSNTPKSKTMPRPLTRDAPSFDKEKPAELIRFLDMVKALFKECGIVDDQEKKNHVRGYADGNSYMEWEAFDTYKAPRTYEEFEEEIIANYPAASSARDGSLLSLDRICNEHQGIRVDALGSLLAFVRAFTVEIKRLQEPPALLTNLQLVDKFLRTLAKPFASQVYDKLSRVAAAKVQPTTAAATTEGTSIPKRRYEDLFDLKDVTAAAIELSRSYSASGFQHALGTDNTGVRIELEEIKEDVKNTFAQLNDHIGLSEKLADNNHKELLKTIMTARVAPVADASYNQAQQTQPQSQNQNQSQNHNQNQSRNNSGPPPARDYGNECWYCGETDHIMMECALKLQDVAQGRIILINGVKVSLPDQKINLRAIPGQFLKDKVNTYYNDQLGKQLYFNAGEGPGSRQAGIYNMPSTYGTTGSVFANAPPDARDSVIAQLLNNMKVMEQKPAGPVGGPVPGHQYQYQAPQMPTSPVNGPGSSMQDQLAEFMAFQNFNNMRNEASLAYGTRSKGPANQEGSQGSGF